MEQDDFPDSIDKWRKLTPTDREFYTFQSLRESRDAKNRFASKWVEKAMWSGIGILAVWVINQILHLIPASIAAAR